MLPSMDTILHDHCRLDPAKPIIVGVSGGPDSLCLMSVLRQAGYRLIVAHFNHKLRPEADIEANNVEQMAARFGLASVIEHADVRAYAEKEGLSLEDAARALRYRFLFQRARQQNAQAVAVGHTADDQVETVLMHFLRGAGLTGLKGMAYRTVLPTFDPEIPIVRPLLDVWREDTILYCATQGLRPHHDPSNQSVNFLRNRLRHLLIPTLETYNPRFREAVLRTAQSLAADHEILTTAADSAWGTCVVQESPGLIIFDTTALAGLAVGLRRNLVRRALEHIHPEAEVTYALLERASAFLADASQRQVDLMRGVRLLREADQIYVVSPEATLPFDRWPQIPEGVESLPLALPERLQLSGSWVLTAEKWNIPALAWEQIQENEDPFQVWLDADSIEGELFLRPRQEGDRFEPLGMGGHTQKLSDFFTNEKLAQRARDRWPLLCVGEKIAWIPGYQPAHSFRVTQSSRRILYFILTKVK
ncbi:MAG: tRNA lysidine(34) synthetase TilS [Chloroflexota bacterium]